MYYLDTNTCIYFLNGRYNSIRTKILGTPPGNICVPSIVKAELLLGAYKSKNKIDTLEKVEKFLEPFKIVSFTDQMTYVYAEIRSRLEKSGILIGPNDLLIGAIVKYREGILVTHNTAEFERINDLIIEDWAADNNF